MLVELWRRFAGETPARQPARRRRYKGSPLVKEVADD